ncbi:hypothetical protein V8D89_002549 [Ganoderma adspersum]
MNNLKIQSTIPTPESGDAYTAALRRHSDLSSLPAKHPSGPRVCDFPTPPVEIAVKGGGAHSATWASSDDGIVIDLELCNPNKVVLAEDRQSASGGGRATLFTGVGAVRDVRGGALVVQFVREKNAELAGQDLGWFISMCQGHEKPGVVFGGNLARLRKIKTKGHPKKVCSKGLVIEPLAE